MTVTYTPIATITTTSSNASVSFANIPSTYRDLILVYNGTNSSSTGGMLVRINADSGNNYNDLFLSHNGDTPAAGIQTNTNNANIFFGTTARTLGISQFIDYSATNKHKTILTRDTAGGTNVRATVTRWANTAAITQIQILRSDATISVGSTFKLFGVIA